MKLVQTLKTSLSVAAIGFLALGPATTSAFAVTNVTTTFGVSATVQATCVISATGLAFGTYTGLLSNNTASVSVMCTNTTPYNVSLNAGTTTGSTVTARKMAGTGGQVLNYALFSDSSRTVNWGQTIGTDTVTGTGNGAAQVLTVYGQVAAGQYVTPGAYSDTITATVTY
jgi:spore coat protein U-like protein